jgi:hypothetical protein
MFIAKSKTKNSFKMIDDIGKVTPDLFQTHDLFHANPVNPQQFTEMIKQKKINDLKAELVSLGVDFAQPVSGSQVTELPESVVDQIPAEMAQELVPNNPNLHSTVSNPKDESTGVERQTVSKVINKSSGRPFSMEELYGHFEKFKDVIERDVPEVENCVFNDNGFVLVTTQHLPNVPRVLPNGIPIKQQVGNM